MRKHYLAILANLLRAESLKGHVKEWFNRAPCLDLTVLETLAWEKAFTHFSAEDSNAPQVVEACREACLMPLRRMME
jgi:hypothetical protein